MQNYRLNLNKFGKASALKMATLERATLEMTTFNKPSLEIPMQLNTK